MNVYKPLTLDLESLKNAIQATKRPQPGSHLFSQPNTKPHCLSPPEPKPLTVLPFSSPSGLTLNHGELSQETYIMRFTDSPVIQLKVRNAPLSIQQDNGSFHVGTSVWPCSLVLVKFLDRWSSLSLTSPNPYDHLLNFSGKRAVELGSGCGVAGMGLAVLGLDVVLTDIAPVMPALKRNIKRNKPVIGKTLKTAQLYWKNADQIRTLNPPFDFVVAADVVYIEESVAPLVSAMEALVADDGVVLLGYQLRSPEADRLFWGMCERAFVIEKVPHGDLHPEYAYEETDVFVLRKKRIRSGEGSVQVKNDS